MVSFNVLSYDQLLDDVLPRAQRHPLPPLVDLAPDENIVRPTWGDLIRHEPRLAALLAEAESVSNTGDPHFCANHVWYRGFKPRLERLVGYFAERDDPMLITSQAYDVAYWACYEVLPACRDCMCA